MTVQLTSSLPLTEQVSAGVRLPSHISAFGENSSDEQLDSLPDAVLEENHAGAGADACSSWLVKGRDMVGPRHAAQRPDV